MKIGFRMFAGALLAAALLPAPAMAKTIKIGLIAPMSGPGSLSGISWTQAIAVYQKMYGKSVDGNPVELIVRDLPGPNPLQARALAQELVVKQGVQYLAGLVYSPNALALGAFADKAHVPIVIMNAATSSIIDKSKYFLRTSYTVPQLSVPEAAYVRRHGYQKMVSMVADYAPGVDAETAFTTAFTQYGGTIAGKIRMPRTTTDYVPYLQRAKLMKPDAIFGFLPGSGQTYEFLTAYINSGLSAQHITYIGQGETDEDDLPRYGELADGLITVMFYSADHHSKANDDFKAVLKQLYPKVVPDYRLVEAFDGMHVIYHMIHATHGEKDGDAAIKSALGLHWQSPRGPVGIDPKTRDFIQNVYVRKVEKRRDGTLYNKELEVFPNQPDYGRHGTAIPTLADLVARKLPN